MTTPDIRWSCPHAPTWRVSSHPDLALAGAMGITYASVLSCDRPTCLANAAKAVREDAGTEEVYSKPVGRGAALLAPEQRRVLVRHTDPESSHEGARKAKASSIKAQVLAWFEERPDTQYAAMEVATWFVANRKVALTSMDAVRRRVQELAAEGRLHRQDNGKEAATYRYESYESSYSLPGEGEA